MYISESFSVQTYPEVRATNSEKKHQACYNKDTENVNISVRHYTRKRITFQSCVCVCGCVDVHRHTCILDLSESLVNSAVRESVLLHLECSVHHYCLLPAIRSADILVKTKQNKNKHETKQKTWFLLFRNILSIDYKPIYKDIHDYTRDLCTPL